MIPVKLPDNFELDQNKFLLIIVACAVVLFVDFNYLIKPQLSGIAKTTSKITALSKELKNITKDVAGIDELKKQQAQINSKEMAKAKKMITAEQVATLLQEISVAANALDIKIEQIKPLKDNASTIKKKAKEAVKPKGKDGGKVADAGNGYDVVKISIDLIADYHHLGKLINALENSTVLVGIGDLQIESQAEDFLKQQVKLTVEAYVKK